MDFQYIIIKYRENNYQYLIII